MLDKQQDSYQARRTEHRRFVRYQRSDYLLSGRVLTARRDGSLLLWTGSGLQKVRLLQPTSEQTSSTLMSRVRALLFRRVRVRIVGRDAQQVLLAQGCRPQDADSSSAQREVPPPCPECGRTMVLRQTHSGPTRGLLIWGCPRYPLCQTVKHLA